MYRFIILGVASLGDKGKRHRKKQAHDNAPTPGKANQGSPRRRLSRWQRWRRRPHPVFRFVVGLVILLGLFQIFIQWSPIKDQAIPSYLRFCARTSGAVMNFFGEKANIHDSTISSARFSINIKRGCDAVQPTTLFIAGVLASPVMFWPKIPGLLIGIFFLATMNLVRVISLFYVGALFSTKTFDFMHHDVWQAAFIVLAILAWGLWAVWAARRTASP